MELQEKLEKIKYIANIISPYNYYALGYLDNFYLAYYKDYHYYSLKEIRNYWLNYLNTNDREFYMNFYIHIPFCKVGCSYCKYTKDTQPSKEKINKYLDYLQDYFDYFSEIFKKSIIVNLHVGGGTPSILSIEQIKRLF